MASNITVAGLGHSIGSSVSDNQEVSKSLGLPDDWMVERTGIVERRVAGENENVLTLATDAVTKACTDAELALDDIGTETVLFHIQMGQTHFAPPAPIVLAAHLGLNKVRTLGIDGVCAEPIAVMEMAMLMLRAGRCERAIVSTSVDFFEVINKADPQTAGLFGSGAGAVVLSANGNPGNGFQGIVHGLQWETHVKHWRLGVVDVRNTVQHDTGVTIETSYYEMQGERLATVALGLLPGLLNRVMAEAGWQPEDVDLFLAHQANAKLLELSAQRFGWDVASVPLPVVHYGNMGPSSLLINLSLARDEGKIKPGTRLILLAFGLGFSFGAMAVEVI
ncbi:3-oxoacyl-ACP synthase III family protein [Nocardia altamirensis]|uniref:3-oxoacyl-ACP synthase III family protein n=1 Tax=Nocardia altamirensis TaxID=472158 RepID=UPI00083FE8F9|nr:ketoacyl-ACP synthase III [Nocardia altamirensis]